MLIGARLCGVVCAARPDIFQDASIPKSYLTALRRHLDIDPYDTNVRFYHPVSHQYFFDLNYSLESRCSQRQDVCAPNCGCEDLLS